LIVIVLTHVVESKLIGHLHDQLITGLDHSLQVGLPLQLLSGIFLLLAQGLQLNDPSAGFFSKVAKLLDFLHSFIEISGQSMGQLYLIGKASYVVTTFSRKHHIINSFAGSAWKVSILGVLHLVIYLVMQCGQSFSCNISNSTLERPPWGSNLDHLVDTADIISRKLLICDHLHVPEIGVPSKQPRGSDE
jgi:hypothetical protein